MIATITSMILLVVIVLLMLRWAERRMREVASNIAIPVWHSASDTPKGRYVVLCDDGDKCLGAWWMVDYDYIYHEHSGWAAYAITHHIKRWAYIADLPPRDTFSNEKSE